MFSLISKLSACGHIQPPSAAPSALAPSQPPPHIHAPLPPRPPHWPNHPSPPPSPPQSPDPHLAPPPARTEARCRRRRDPLDRGIRPRARGKDDCRAASAGHLLDGREPSQLVQEVGTGGGDHLPRGAVRSAKAYLFGSATALRLDEICSIPNDPQHSATQLVAAQPCIRPVFSCGCAHRVVAPVVYDLAPLARLYRRRVHIQPSHRSLEPARGRIQSQTPLASTCAEIQHFTQHFSKLPRDGSTAVASPPPFFLQMTDFMGCFVDLLRLPTLIPSS